MSENKFKVAVVGCGKVGMAAAYAMLIKGQVSELVLWGREIKKVMGEKMDLDEAQPLMPKAEIVASDKWEDLRGVDVVVYAAGVAQKPGETRLELTAANVKIMEELLPEILKVAPEAVVLMVTNPVDVLVYKGNKLPGVSKGRIFGSGTMLDTMRFRHYLGESIGVDAHNIHAYVLGEHGDHSFPAYEKAMVGGQQLLEFPRVNEEVVKEAYEKAKDAAYKIIEAKGATYYAIGMVVSRLIEAIRDDERVIMPLSVPLESYHGVSGVALSVPCLLGRSGVEEVLDVDMSEGEEGKFRVAAEEVKKFI